MEGTVRNDIERRTLSLVATGFRPGHLTSGQSDRKAILEIALVGPLKEIRSCRPEIKRLHVLVFTEFLDGVQDSLIQFANLG